MGIAVRKLNPLFAAEVTGVDLSAPLDDELFAQIRDAFNEHAVLVLPDQKLDSDSSFKRVPAMASLLSARELPPEGSETEFADMRAAWDALPEEKRRGLDGLVAEHSLVYSRGLIGYGQFSEAERAALPPVQQALVRTHPATGRKALYLGSHASHIIGWPVEEGRRLLRELLEFAPSRSSSLATPGTSGTW